MSDEKRKKQIYKARAIAKKIIDLRLQYLYQLKILHLHERYNQENKEARYLNQIELAKKQCDLLNDLVKSGRSTKDDISNIFVGDLSPNCIFSKKYPLCIRNKMYEMHTSTKREVKKLIAMICDFSHKLNLLLVDTQLEN